MKNRSVKITDLAILLLFAVFALCVLSLLLTGADQYRRIRDAAAEDHSRRSAARYISMRVRQGDQADALSTESFDGCQTLCIRERIEGKIYLTRVYCFDGFIRELFTREDAQVQAQDGEKIVQADSLSFLLEGSRLSVLVSQEGYTQHIRLTLRSGGETP